MRAQTRRESQQRRIREKNSSKGLTANYLESEIFEDDEQELEESLAAIKNKYKKDIKGNYLDICASIFGIIRVDFCTVLAFHLLENEHIHQHRIVVTCEEE